MKRGSPLCGSVQNSMPSARQAASVSARVRSSSGRPVDLERTPHARQRPATGSAGQPEQHRLGLVVEGVPEEHGAGGEALRDLGEYGVPRLAGRRLGTEPGRLDA